MRGWEGIRSGEKREGEKGEKEQRSKGEENAEEEECKEKAVTRFIAVSYKHFPTPGRSHPNQR